MADVLPARISSPAPGAPAAAQGIEGRSARRYTLLIRSAKLLIGGGEYLCIMRDASETGVSVRIFHPLPAHHDTVIEMQNGDRHRLELVWQDAERAGFRFCDPASIARIIECPSGFAKRPVRLNLSAPAQIEIMGQPDYAELRDISQQGAKIACNRHLAIDQQVKLLVDGMRDVFAKVRWRRDGMIGLVFEETLQLDELARIACRLQDGG